MRRRLRKTAGQGRDRGAGLETLEGSWISPVWLGSFSMLYVEKSTMLTLTGVDHEGSGAVVSSLVIRACAPGLGRCAWCYESNSHIADKRIEYTVVFMMQIVKYHRRLYL